MEALLSSGGIFGLLIGLFVIFIAILAILMPFFVWRIHENIRGIHNAIEILCEDALRLLEK